MNNNTYIYYPTWFAAEFAFNSDRIEYPQVIVAHYPMSEEEKPLPYRGRKRQ
jgi:hypothetical protein